jgi:oxepin-CoA hydrolase / 3-oxo-5,6-dehydrosuberyl-CoA semialdehyde dehydrogenase
MTREGAGHDCAPAATPWRQAVPAYHLILSFAAGLFVQPDPGPVLANYGLGNLRFLKPVYPGDELTVMLTCKQITPHEDADHGEVRWDTVVTNQGGNAVATYDVLTRREAIGGLTGIYLPGAVCTTDNTD